MRTTNVIKLGFVEVGRRTRAMVCVVTVARIDRIICAIFDGLNNNPGWKIRTLRFFAHAA